MEKSRNYQKAGEYYQDNFPVDYVLPYSINVFKVYVNKTDYFTSNLSPLNITTKYSAKWDLKESYFQSIIGTWIATYASGISIEQATSIQVYSLPLYVS